MRAIVEISNRPPVVVDLIGYDRIRERSPQRINAEVAHRMEDEVRDLSKQNKAVISSRIEELDREWDIDRALLGAQIGFLGLHAASGWCPPAVVLRRLGFRSRFEIDAERYALKTLRGDFAL